MDGLVGRLCEQADPPCNDLGNLEHVPVLERWRIREALVLLKGAFGNDDRRLQTLLDTPIVVGDPPLIEENGAIFAIARAALGKDPETGDTYLLLNAAWLKDPASVVRLLLLSVAARQQPMFPHASATTTDEPSLRATRERNEVDCRIHMIALRDVEQDILRIRNWLSGQDTPTVALRNAFDDQLVMNRSELKGYLQHCGSST